MKKHVLQVVFATCIIAMVSCQNQTMEKTKEKNLEMAVKKEANIASLPVMTFSEKDHDFGNIKEGDVVKHSFTFKNTGKSPLVIINAKGSCGCTVSEWSKEPINPGESGSLLVSFNSNGKPNMQIKQVTITNNTEKGKELLKIHAMVTPKNKGGI